MYCYQITFTNINELFSLKLLNNLLQRALVIRFYRQAKINDIF